MVATGFALDEPTRAYIRHVAAARFGGNRSKALRFIVAKAGTSIEAEAEP
jgi:hypothetical protein